MTLAWAAMTPLVFAAPLANAPIPAAERETIYILHSIREPQAASAAGCPAALTGFEPFSAEAERYFSFWSIESQSDSGRVINARRSRVASLRGCFGPTAEPARQNFNAEIQLGAMTFRGHGECVALMVDFPEKGLYPVRCHLVLAELPAPFVGGLLTTNTLTSAARFGGDTEPPGYVQASIATIRLWRRHD